jgi:hypothetical protein
MEKGNLGEKFAAFTEHWRLKIVGELNGQEVKGSSGNRVGGFGWKSGENEGCETSNCMEAFLD